MSTEVVLGRPDFADRSFGVTQLKRFPPYVYSLLGGMLVHKVESVEARWYKPQMNHLERLSSPALIIRAVCGQVFYAGQGCRRERSRSCALPRPDAVLCGRCHGTGPVFGRGLAERAVTRREAKQRLGCIVEV